MSKLTDCLKINKQIDKSNNSQIIGGFTRKPAENPSNYIKYIKYTNQLKKNK